MPPSHRPEVSAVASPPRRSLTYDDLSITEQLGDGGHATVYKAAIKGYETPECVAVKEPTNEAQTLPADDAMEFLQEAETWEQLDYRERHKQLYAEYEHLVGIVDTGDRLPWIAMEYMDGGTLAERLEGSNGLPLPKLRWFATCVCRGVELAHYEGISHLDLKPSNVLFRSTPEGQWDVAKIADWGTSRRPLESTEENALSAAFSAPEQFDPDTFGEPDSMTDVYQIGAIIYAMAVGEPPYTGSRIEISNAATEGPELPSTHRDELPDEFDQVVARAMAPDKQDRYRTIRDLASAIADVPAARTTANGGTTQRASSDSILAPVGSGESPADTGRSPQGANRTAGATGGVDSTPRTDRDSSPVPEQIDEVGEVGFPPCKQPVEVFPADGEYLVREFRSEPSNATVFSSHDKRMAAMRAASNRLTEDNHPCTLRWDSHNSVGDLYWNEHFESLGVEYSELFDAWVVVSKPNAYTFCAAPSAKWAYKDGKRIQQAYDFKQLEICSRQGDCQKTVEHRFIRHSLTKSGVTFNR
jgi:serine/threonine protein kinase